MRLIRLMLSVGILCVFFASTLLAQEALTETFTSDDGVLTFNYPAGWVVGYEGSDIIGGNSQAAIDAALNQQQPASDQVVFLSYAPITVAELGIGADATVVEALRVVGEGSLEPEERTVSGVSLAVAVVDTVSREPNIWAARALENGVFMFVLAATAPESVDIYLPTLLEILASSVYSPPPPGGGAVLELPEGTIPDPAPGTGDVIWEVNMDGRQIFIQNLAVDTQGNIYLAIEPYPFTDSSGDDGLRGLLVFNTDGSFQRGFYNTETDLRLTEMTVGADGSIWFSKFGYGGGTSSELFGLDPDGNLFARFRAGIGFLGEGEFVVVSGSDGNLYTQVSGEAVRVYAPDGGFVREFDARGQLAAASLDGALYFVVYDDVFAVEATDLEGGSLGVSVPFGEDVRFITGVAAAQGIFYIADSSRMLRQYDSAGMLTGSYELENLVGNLAVLPDGDVIVTYRNTLARVHVSGMVASAPPSTAPAASSDSPPIITRNEDWTPVERDFDGVTMVLVPPGCFMMGSTQHSAAVGAGPVHEQCFDEPFWIDKYEVTQGQFARLGGVKAASNQFAGDDRPVESIAWFEARDFCELRGAGLPTEVEWEYAARGPSGLNYPWGDAWLDDWDLNPAVSGDVQGETAAVGSMPEGMSWVGAMDMSGNVWEFTHALYQPYPYDGADGREEISAPEAVVVNRGGAWQTIVPEALRATYRNRARSGAEGAAGYVGFRCARPFSNEAAAAAPTAAPVVSQPLAPVAQPTARPTLPPPPTPIPTQPPSSAASAGIEYGQTITGNLVSGARDSYTFRGNARDVISISMTSPNFDTYLELMGPDGTRVAFNDDGGQGLNSLINGFSLPASGAYTIIARGFSTSASGAYELTLTLGTITSSAAPAPTTIPTTAPVPTAAATPRSSGRTTVESGTIEYGETINGQLGQNEAHHYSLRGNAGDVISISMTSPDFDTYLELLASDGTRIAFNDDGGEGLNSLINGFSLPASGTYTIVAFAFRDTANGPYELSLVLGTITLPTATPRPTSTPVPSTSMGSIEYGQIVQATLARGNRDAYTLRGNAGDVISISMTSAAFDTYLEIFSADGTRIAFNDDGGEGLNSLINGFSLPASGAFTIVARGYSASATGDYELSLVLGTITLPTATPRPTSTPVPSTSMGSIEYGQIVQATLARGNRDAYTLRGNAGDVITVSLTSAAFDTYLEIFSADGTRIAFNDDGGEGLNSLISAFNLPADGEYTIIARGYSTSATGDYVLRLTFVEVTSSTRLAYGDSVRGTLTSGARDRWTFEGSAGDRVTISLISTAFDTYLELLGPTGSQLVTNDDGGQGLNSLISDFNLPTNGTYTIIARGFSSTASGAYTLELTAAGGSSTSGATVRQWAARAQATSQYGNPRWGAIQATGAPNTARCGDLPTAWASSSSRGRDSLTLYYDQAVIPTQINIHQTYTPGSIISVDLIQANGTIVRVPNSADPGTPCPGIFTLNITQTNLSPVNGVIINLDQTVGGNWNEIDAVELVGTP